MTKPLSICRVCTAPVAPRGQSWKCSCCGALRGRLTWPRVEPINPRRAK